ncbi:MAG: hypothetical protein DRP10_03925 [Candidatus Aenigmatarchaeota archaeon]|nr:MAG: hypothetical protein DRP10_03925 [Candidatus Aenigmarchaeota archaeon]
MLEEDIYQTTLDRYGIEVAEKESPIDRFLRMIKEGGSKKHPLRHPFTDELEMPVPEEEVVPGPLGYVSGNSKSTIHRVFTSDGIKVYGCFGCGKGYIRY